MEYCYYKHDDSSVVRVKFVSEFGREVLKFCNISEDHLLYGRERSLPSVSMDQHWHVKVRDGLLVRSEGEMYYLHDTPAPETGEVGDIPHFYRFDPTKGEMVQIEATLAAWKQEYEEMRFRAGW